MKLFVDQETHMPLMLTYEGVLPRMFFRGGGHGGPNAQRPTPEEIEKMRKEPPQQVTYEVHFADYKKVDGVLLPHLITQSVNGKATEEFTDREVQAEPTAQARAVRQEGFIGS